MNDSALAALADEDRRELLSLLATRDGEDQPVLVPGDLAARTPHSTAMATRLHHVHLPKLASMEYVEWDPASGAVRRGPAFEELEPLLRVLHEHGPRASD